MLLEREDAARLQCAVELAESLLAPCPGVPIQLWTERAVRMKSNVFAGSGADFGAPVHVADLAVEIAASHARRASQVGTRLA